MHEPRSNAMKEDTGSLLAYSGPTRQAIPIERDTLFR